MSAQDRVGECHRSLFCRLPSGRPAAALRAARYGTDGSAAPRRARPRAERRRPDRSGSARPAPAATSRSPAPEREQPSRRPSRAAARQLRGVEHHRPQPRRSRRDRGVRARIRKRRFVLHDPVDRPRTREELLEEVRSAPTTGAERCRRRCARAPRRRAPSDDQQARCRAARKTCT